ncbi:MAG: GTP-binding protein, partial [Hyphomicrobiaceae bacterium]
SVLRCKGWVRFNDAPHSVVLVQGVGARLEFVDTHPGLFGSRPRLVIICRNDGVSVGRVKMAMRALSSSANIEERPTLAG